MDDFSKWPLLSGVSSPADVKKLPEAELPELCREIREYLVFRVGENGGHLASNLGVTELTVALHRVFSTPHDHILFDVGHQSYVHKLLTGRREAFDTLRRPGGLSGFTRRDESASDAFGAGHSSTAISAALGLSEADALLGSDAYTVAVVGDGAMTGGLSYEALNNCRRSLRLILILNENEMSISRNTGRMAVHLSHLRASRNYLRTKEVTRGTLLHIPLIGRPVYKILRRAKRRIKHLFYEENLFEHMGIRYMGPVDGNDLPGLLSCLEHAKKLDCSVLLHIKTVKGKGLPAAEADPNRYHALPPRGCKKSGRTFSESCGQVLLQMAKRDEKICAITAAMADGTGLTPFRAVYPRRFFDVGIAEEHAVTFAAGLSAGGMHPVVAVYSTFLQRAYDEILHDAVLQRLPLVLCVDRAGLSPGDGMTHHGIYDVAFLSEMPGVHIFAPVTEEGVEAALRAAFEISQKEGALAAVRYPSGTPDETVREAFYPMGASALESPRVRIFETGEAPALTFLTHGRETGAVLSAARELQKEGVFSRVLLCEYLAPYEALAQEVRPLLRGRVLFCEEEIRAGGFGVCLSDALFCRGAAPEYEILATGDGRVSPQAGESIFAAAGVDAAGIVRAARKLLKRKRGKEDDPD